MKIIAKYNDKETDISFPCSEAHLSKKIKELTGSEDYPANMFVKEFVEPTQFNSLKDTFQNLDELNYLAKRMDSFSAQEEDTFFAAMENENITNVAGLINLTFNLPHYTLIQELKDMEKVGRQHMMNIALLIIIPAFYQSLMPSLRGSLDSVTICLTYLLFRRDRTAISFPMFTKH